MILFQEIPGNSNNIMYINVKCLGDKHSDRLIQYLESTCYARQPDLTGHFLPLFELLNALFKETLKKAKLNIFAYN